MRKQEPIKFCRAKVPGPLVGIFGKSGLNPKVMQKVETMGANVEKH